ncbi:probable ATP-dependent RNA helicase spindle-E [Anopheles nili]|uniref:probable ATP-dependent RNA helicase spindle-E n=1 Tax=Anopheles nili TaxID=185578 RepID=UPI00237A8D3D|nr:probable ATP-dependent RNA helicase spindle-E [Anopheles nili]
MEEDDDVNNFFNFSKPFQRKIISGGYCNGSVVTGKLNIQTLPQRNVEGTEYAAKYSKAEEARLMESWVNDALHQTTTSHLDDVDDALSLAEEDTEHLQRVRAQELMEPLFSRFNFTVNSSALSIHQSKHAILNAIRENPVVVLQGTTGCGKTTQVPQYLLEDAYNRKEYCNIIVTQPRKIATASIAKRVAEERSCELGSLVGFKVGLKEVVSNDTRLMYVTTGVLLNILITSKSLSRYTHIILDEVHEREVDMDFLLIIVRRLLPISRNTKIILMSATIEAQEFAQYFKIPGPNSLLAPQLSVSKCRQHNVAVFYLDNLEKLAIDFSLKYDQPEVHDKMYFLAAKLAIVCDRLIDEYESPAQIDYKPSIIMFLPGINEIERMADVLQNFLGGNIPDAQRQTKFSILKLHSMLPSDQQALVFRKPPPGHRKVILSTNIAESSVTIPDIKFVIDFCLQRLLVTDSLNNFTSLRTQWASRNNCIQRAGRTGRVMNGRVYRLVNKHFYDHGMAQSVEPEMVRCPLGITVLKTKRLDMGAPHTILALALSPPNLCDISNTVLQLKELGALRRTTKGKYDPQDGDLTYLGMLMSQLPVDLHLAKLVVLGYVFSVLDEAIVIAAGMNVKNIFRQLRTIEAFSCKRHWADGSNSDGIAILNAYNTWCSVKEMGTGGNTVSWCQRYHLDLKSLSEMAELVQEIKMRLAKLNIRSMTGAKRVNWTRREKSVVLKVVMAGAFYPHYFIPVSMNESEMGDRKVYMEVGGRDPFSTVFFSGFEHANYIGPLYRQQIKLLLTERKPDPEKHALMKVEFERSTNKIFIRFLHPPAQLYEGLDAPDRIHPGVFDAIKLRHVRCGQSELMVMHHYDAISFATEKKLGVWKDNEWHPRCIEIPNAELSVEPQIHWHRLTAVVTHVVHPNKFYLRPNDKNIQIYEEIQHRLNGGEQLRSFDSAHVFEARQIVAAPLVFNQTQLMARAKLLVESKNRGVIEWAVFFLDFGATANVAVSYFRQLEGTMLDTLTKIPDRVFEASLAEVQPSVVYSPKDIWTDETVKHFQRLVLGKEMHVEIYSVVNHVVMVVLRCNATDSTEQSINRELVASQHAQLSEESYMSKMNHEKRQRVQLDMEVDKQYREQILNDSSEQQRYLEDDEQPDLVLPSELLKMRLTLRGPYSPLEVKCSSALFSGYRKPVVIENESINSVLLDTNPQNPYDKLLVAATMNEMGNNRLVARLTSMMPNIPGLPVLMALIFAPTCMLKKDPDETRVVGLLAGLGCEPETNASIYPEHDMSLAADVIISEKDIADINALRYTMDSILQGGYTEQTPLLTEHSIGSLMAKVKDYLIKILQRERSITENRSMAHDFNWFTGDGPSKTKRREASNNIYPDAIFPLYDNLNLRPIPANRIEFFKVHCAELHRLTESRVSLPKGGITCQLCNVTLESEHALRIHFFSKLHRDRETIINFRR